MQIFLSGMIWGKYFNAGLGIERERAVSKGEESQLNMDLNPDLCTWGHRQISASFYITYLC